MAESEILTAVKGHTIEVDDAGEVAAGPNEYFVPEGERPPALSLFIREDVSDAEAAAYLSNVLVLVSRGQHRE